MTRRSSQGGMIRHHPVWGTWEARYTAADGRRRSLYAKTRREARGLLYRPTRGTYRFALPLFGPYLRRHRKVSTVTALRRGFVLGHAELEECQALWIRALTTKEAGLVGVQADARLPSARRAPHVADARWDARSIAHGVTVASVTRALRWGAGPPPACP